MWNQQKWNMKKGQVGTAWKDEKELGMSARYPSLQFTLCDEKALKYSSHTVRTAVSSKKR